MSGLLYRGVTGLIVGAILYYPTLFFLISQKLTDEDTLTFYLAIILISLSGILYFLNNEESSGLLFVRAIVVGFSYHAVFWFYCVNTYNFTNVWDALRTGFIYSAIYLVLILTVGFIIKRFNLFWITENIQRAKQRKQQTKLQNEISWLNRNATKIIDEMRGYISTLDGSFSKTPSESRNLLFLFSSVSNEENILKLGQQHVVKEKSSAVEIINRLNSSIEQLKNVTKKIRLYQNIQTLNEQITEFEKTLRQLEVSVKKEDTTLQDTFHEEDHRTIYFNLVKQEFRDLVNRFGSVQ